MGHTFGIFSKGQKGVTFGNMQAFLVEGVDHPNHPVNPDSPNKPRVPGRLPGYPNPILGDEGVGKIGRWQTIKLDALETLVDQMIEQYLRDKSWYSLVRCREALWNMYRRLLWWVQQQTDPQREDHKQALQMIKDCINKILEAAQEPGGEHMGIILPHCPAPYKHHYSGDYFNHFDGNDVEVKLFDFGDFPVMDSFPGFFRYVSSAEDQEWELVHRVGGNEMQGTENIMKLNINRLKYGNSSKITFNWRFKKRGFIRFKFLASVAAGNGLTFFINNNQVGGEWSRNTDWQEVRFNVQPGQTYKFDWFVRRQTSESFGYDAIYIKDVECVEVIRSLEHPVPPDYDTLGSTAYEDDSYEWITFSSSSVVRTDFYGVVKDDNRTRTWFFPIDNECDGEVKFSYRMKANTPSPEFEWNLVFQDNFRNHQQQVTGKRGSTVVAEHQPVWLLDGDKSQTQENGAKITYVITAGDRCAIQATGVLKVICPAREIDHYVDTVERTLNNSSWSHSGNYYWQILGGTSDRNLRIDNPVAGYGAISTNVYVEDGGWFTFTYDHDLRPTERFVVRVDGQTVYESGSIVTGSTITIPLTPGSHTIMFMVIDTLTESPVLAGRRYQFSYGYATRGKSYTLNGDFGSKAIVTRNMRVDNSGAWADYSGERNTYQITLNPGAKARLVEKVRVYPATKAPGPQNPTRDVLIFSENFNDPSGAYDPRIIMTGFWEWEDIYGRFNPGGYGDGVYKVEKKDGSINTIVLPNIYLPSAGYIEFEYGGKFGSFEYLEFYVDDVLVWNDRQNAEGPVGHFVTVPIPAGLHTFKWVYKDLSGGVVNVGGENPSTPITDNPYGEECFPAGSQTHDMRYGSLAGSEVTTPRQTQFYNSGQNVYTSATGHATEVNGGYISRSFYIPSYANLVISERVRVYAGLANQAGMKVAPIDLFQDGTNSRNRFYKSDDYFALHVAGVNPRAVNNTAFWISTPFPVNREVDIDFDFIAYLVDSTGIKRGNSSGVYANSRAEFRVWLVKDGENMSDSNRELYWVDNVGKKQRFNNVTDWSGARKHRIRKTLSPGNYRIVFGIRDVLPDLDKDAESYFYYVAVRNLKVRTDGYEADKYWDDTRVIVELINKTTGVIEETRVLYGRDGVNGFFDTVVRFYPKNPGNLYEVRYSLVRGEGTEGGLYDRGGAVLVSEGKIVEQWTAYCRDSNGNYYKQGQSPNPPIGGPGGGSVPVYMPPGDDSWCWIDAINIYVNSSGPCPGTQVDVYVRDSSGNVISHQTYSSTDESLIDVLVENTSTVVQTYYIETVFNAGCPGDGAKFWGGSLEIIDALQPRPAYARITDFRVVNHKPIWMGGCDDSNIKVTVYDENMNVLIPTKTFTSASDGVFVVNELLDPTYTKYVVVIETDQRGVISPVTGKRYYSTFQLLDFKVFEEYHNIPDPFNSELRFYIDGKLIDTFRDEGGFYTVSYPIEKGVHELRWVFETFGDGNVWDTCEIDFLELTNWICDFVWVTPYCEPGAGDKCVESLIRCLLLMIKEKPKACVIGKKIWLFT